MNERMRGPSNRPEQRFPPRYRPGPPGPREDFRPYGPGSDGRFERRADPLPPPPARNDWRPPPFEPRDNFRPRGGGRGAYTDRRPAYDRERDPKVSVRVTFLCVRKSKAFLKADVRPPVNMQRRRMEEPPPPARDQKVCIGLYGPLKMAMYTTEPI